MINSQQLLLPNMFIYFLICITILPKYIQSTMTTIITIEYYIPSSNYTSKIINSRTSGIVSTRGSQSTVRNGQAFILTDANGISDGCFDPKNNKTYPGGVAIIQRGGNCTFSTKITRGKQLGAAAVMIYDPIGPGSEMFNMLQNNTDILSVYVQQSIGYLLFNLTKDPNTQLNITLQPINMEFDDFNQDNGWFGSQSATIFIAVSICILISLCVSWLIFYYCQRHRARTAKDRLQNRLSNAAKKALTKIPLVNITESPQTEEACVICLDTIKTGDTIRQLVCNHTFHHHCVDPWLLNNRHCPLCNLDILAAYRISVPSTTNHHHRRRQTHRSNNNNNNNTGHSIVSIATTSASPISEQQMNVTLPTISATIKEDSYNVPIHGEQNPSFRSDENVL